MSTENERQNQPEEVTSLNAGSLDGELSDQELEEAAGGLPPECGIFTCDVYSGSE